MLVKLRKLVRSVITKLIGLFYKPSAELAEKYSQYEIGQYTYGDLKVVSWGGDTTLKVGAYTSVAAGVKVILGGEHRVDWVSTYPFNVLWSDFKYIKGHPKSKGDVVIGNDVWIGTEAIILSGVTIGDGAVIGARSVVTKDIPPYAIAAGNPAKTIKYRFDNETISRLLKLQWWKWNHEKVKKAVPDILNTSIDVFLKKAEEGNYD